MRLIDADELLQEVMGITDGYLKPPKNWRWYEDSIRNAPTIDARKELAQEIYDMIINKEDISCFTDKQYAQYFNNKLMEILNKVKSIMRS